MSLMSNVHVQFKCYCAQSAEDYVTNDVTESLTSAETDALTTAILSNRTADYPESTLPRSPDSPSLDGCMCLDSQILPGLLEQALPILDLETESVESSPRGEAKGSSQVIAVSAVQPHLIEPAPREPTKPPKLFPTHPVPMRVNQG